MLLIASLSFQTIVFEILLTRIFSIVLFGPQADLAVSLGILGIGIGAVFAFYVSDADAALRRMSRLPALVGAVIVALTYIILEIPLTTQSAIPPESFQERSSLVYEIVNTPLLAITVLLLLLPFALSGYGISLTLSAARERVNGFYGADLLAGAFGACIGYGLLYFIATPDIVFVCLAAGCVTSLMIAATPPRGISKGLLMVGGALGVVIVLMSSLDDGFLQVKYASGYSEQAIVFSEWSPLSRVAVNRSPKTGAESIVLDNASASVIIRNEDQIRETRKLPSRGLAYRIQQPCGDVAIIGASAGPEVSVANWYGCKSIDAIDIVGKIFEVVRKRYPEGFNPYLLPQVNTIGLDGRTAIALSEKKYDVIQMVHANLWSNAGVISNAWSHSYLETQEAFAIYLAQLKPDGLLSFSRGIETPRLFQAALGALQKMHPESYWRYLLTTSGRGDLLLVRPRPWTQAEVARVQQLLDTGDYGSSKITFNPLIEAPPPGLLTPESTLTDDRPFSYVPSVTSNFWKWISGSDSIFNFVSREHAPLAFVYSVMGVQFGIILVFGGLLLVVPSLLRPRPMKGELLRSIPFLLFGFFVGYGFMAIELVALNKAILYLGDPSLSAAVIIAVMLLAAGAGAMRCTKRPHEFQGMSVVWIVLLAPVTFKVLTLLPAIFPMQSIFLRALLVGSIVSPIAYFMGQPFTLMMQHINGHKKELTPWVFAVNTWASVLAGFGTTLMAHFYGYSYAGALGVLGYLGCLLLFVLLQKQVAAASKMALSVLCCIVLSACTRGDDVSAKKFSWIALPKGTYKQGISEDALKKILSKRDISKALYNQAPREVPQVVREVQPFELLAHEVTVSQYMECVKEGVCKKPADEDRCTHVRPDPANLPMSCVDWHDADTFCRWIGARLPSEIEWEYAAKNAGQEVRYPWGNDPEPNCNLAVIDEGGRGCGRRTVWPVCSMRSGNTKQGLCDMAGNAWEWTADYLAPYPGFNVQLLKDLGLEAKEVFYEDCRVMRGGGISSFNDYRTTLRTCHKDDFKYGALSFRCARSL